MKLDIPFANVAKSNDGVDVLSFREDFFKSGFKCFLKNKLILFTNHFFKILKMWSPSPRNKNPNINRNQQISNVKRRFILGNSTIVRNTIWAVDEWFFI